MPVFDRNDDMIAFANGFERVAAPYGDEIWRRPYSLHGRNLAGRLCEILNDAGSNMGQYRCWSLRITGAITPRELIIHYESKYRFDHSIGWEQDRAIAMLNAFEYEYHAESWYPRWEFDRKDVEFMNWWLRRFIEWMAGLTGDDRPYLPRWKCDKDGILYRMHLE